MQRSETVRPHGHQGKCTGVNRYLGPHSYWYICLLGCHAWTEVGVDEEEHGQEDQESLHFLQHLMCHVRVLLVQRFLLLVRIQLLKRMHKVGGHTLEHLQMEGENEITEVTMIPKENKEQAILKIREQDRGEMKQGPITTQSHYIFKVSVQCECLTSVFQHLETVKVASLGSLRTELKKIEHVYWLQAGNINQSLHASSPSRYSTT